MAVSKDLVYGWDTTVCRIQGGKASGELVTGSGIKLQ